MAVAVVNLLFSNDAYIIRYDGENPSRGEIPLFTALPI
jgi:hypothetical protein